MSDSQGFPGGFQAGELLWGPPSGDRQMLGRRTQVLADRDDVGPDGAEVGQRRDHLVLTFTQPQDETGLRSATRRLGPGQDREAPRVRRVGTHGPLQARDRLDVVVEHVGGGVEDRVE